MRVMGLNNNPPFFTEAVWTGRRCLKCEYLVCVGWLLWRWLRKLVSTRVKLQGSLRLRTLSNLKYYYQKLYLIILRGGGALWKLTIDLCTFVDVINIACPPPYSMDLKCLILNQQGFSKSIFDEMMTIKRQQGGLTFVRTVFIQT